MTDWYVGQKVVCIRVDSRWRFKPEIGPVYTISKIELPNCPESTDPLYFRLAELSHIDFAWSVFAFRPVVSGEKAFSELRALLDKLPSREAIDA